VQEELLAKHRIAIVVGSLRNDSLNRKVAKSLCALASDMLDCKIVEIGRLPLYNQDDEASPSAEVGAFREQIAEADGVLFCTPEYNRSIPGVLKNAIDIGSRPYGKSVWDKKPGAVVTASPGGIGGFGSNHHLRQSCVFLNMPIMQQPEAYLGHVTNDSFDEDGQLKDGALRDLILQVAKAFADWVDLIVRGRLLIAEDAAHASKARS
jgi:chromate reductase